MMMDQRSRSLVLAVLSLLSVCRWQQADSFSIGNLPSRIVDRSFSTKVHKRSGAAVNAGSGDDDAYLFPEEQAAEGDMSSTSFARSESFVSEADAFEQANALAAQTTVELPSEIEQSFMQYALSIILGRALPDARDGLKPVHRRILFAMSELGLVSNQAHRKCARVVGEVLGKYHPHGDMAVYDALVRMAQDFSTGTPLIDGHGNFGSIDADPAAAMRYTECRLTRVAQEALLDDLYEDTVDFLPNFDGNEQEPVVLPSKLPVLLLNGCSGIAVGMATNVPPHNLNELLAGCTALVEARQNQNELSDDDLFKIIPGPDFPTGALILGQDGAKELYSTGRGGITMRATTRIESVAVGKKSTRTAIVVTALPYQVNKALLLEKIAGLVNDKKLDGIADLRDESDRDGMRVIIELKRDANADVVLNNLYKKTSLQSQFSGNFLALMGSGTVPQRFTLRSALDCFLDFRFDTIRRRSAFQLRKVESRAHIVDGLLGALERVDEVIDWIRSAPDQNAARESLMDESDLGLSREQADAVLRLQLGQLTRLNKGKLQGEKEDLLSSEKRLQELLTVDNTVLETMLGEFRDMQSRFGVERRTQIETDDEGELEEIDLVKNSQSVIVVTRGGYVKRMPLKTFESQGRGTRGKRGTSDSTSGNEVAHCFTCNDHDTLLMISQRGIAYGLRAYQIPTGGRTAKGLPMPSVLPISTDDVITTMLPVSEFREDEFIVLVTEQGYIKRTSLAAFSKLTSRGLVIASLTDDDRLLIAHHCQDENDVLVASTQGKATRFAVADIRPSSRTTRGVKCMKLKDGDSITDMNVLKGSCEEEGTEEASEFVLAVTANGFGKRMSTSSFRTQARNGMGVIAMKFKSASENDSMICLRTVREDDEVLLITSKGIMVRQQIGAISSQSRTATGVVLQKLDEGDSLTTASIVPPQVQ